MIFRAKKFEQNRRFRRPEFQKKLASARRFQRKSEPLPETQTLKVLGWVGLGTRLARIFAAILVLLVIYFLTLSDFFLVKTALPATEGSLTAEKLNEALERLGHERSYLVPKNHFLLLTKARALQALREQFPEIKQIVSYKRVFPDVIELSLLERRAEYVWQSGNDYFFLDQDGIAFEKILPPEPGTFGQMLINDRAGTPVVLGEAAKNPKVLNFISTLTEKWGSQIDEAAVQNIEIPNPASADIIVKTTQGFVVYFDLERDALVQLENLAYLLKQEIGSDRQGGLSYLDLRLPNIGYYCFKDAPCAFENATSTNP